MALKIIIDITILIFYNNLYLLHLLNFQHVKQFFLSNIYQLNFDRLRNNKTFFKKIVEQK